MHKLSCIQADKFLTPALLAVAAMAFHGVGQCIEASPAATGEERDLFSDTWVATDALGRQLPLGGEVRPPRNDKQVGIFFFTWHGAHGYQGYGGRTTKTMTPDEGVVPKTKPADQYQTPHNLSKLLAENPQNPRLGEFREFHHWGEPELGFYVANDRYVIRKHAEMLADAGVDFLFVDATNGYVYKGIYDVIFSEYEKLRAEGRKVPKFAFITYTHCDYKKVITKLYQDIYKPGRYRDLWFEWQGKPLILANSKGLPEEIKNAFTWRESWAWTSPGGGSWFGDGRDKWPWLDHSPQNHGWHESPDKPEQIVVSVAQHPTTNIGRSHRNGVQPPRDQARPGLGLYFEEQWKRALEVDAPVTMITGWNEWVAQRFIGDGEKLRMFGKVAPKGSPVFVDAFDEEYNRDIEPMKGGSNDNLYYQMVGKIRQLKGARPLPPAGPPRTILIDGDFADWNDVTPEYRDHAFDTTHRDHMGWGRIDRYVNTTGRNDIISAMVARDASNLHFLAVTREGLTAHTDSDWMRLFIDADRNASTGWMGFDFVVNMEPVSDRETSIHKAVPGDKGGFIWQPLARTPYRASGNRIEIAVPAGLLGWQEKPGHGIDFKWADNTGAPNDPEGFFTKGDAAPSRRFKYRYVIAAE